MRRSRRIGSPAKIASEFYHRLMRTHLAIFFADRGVVTLQPCSGALACVAGGIVGARELKSFGGGAVRSEREAARRMGRGTFSLLAALPPKLSFARAYNTASYAGYRGSIEGRFEN